MMCAIWRFRTIYIFSNETNDLDLDDSFCFPRRVIYKRDDVDRPLSLYDLNPLDFFLWSFLKWRLFCSVKEWYPFRGRTKSVFNTNSNKVRITRNFPINERVITAWSCILVLRRLHEYPTWWQHVTAHLTFPSACPIYIKNALLYTSSWNILIIILNSSYGLQAENTILNLPAVSLLYFLHQHAIRNQKSLQLSDVSLNLRIQSLSSHWEEPERRDVEFN